MPMTNFVLTSEVWMTYLDLKEAGIAKTIFRFGFCFCVFSVSCGLENKSRKEISVTFLKFVVYNLNSEKKEEEKETPVRPPPTS